MRVTVFRAIDDFVLNIRDTDEIGEAEGMSDSEIDGMECELKRIGRFWIDADTYVRRTP